MKKLTVVGAAAMLVVGCSVFPTSNLSGNKSLVVTPQIIDSAYKSQTAVGLWTSADVTHLVLELKVDTTVKATKDVLFANLGQPVLFSNLKNGTIYTVQAYAYKSADTSNQISVDASSSVTINVGTDDRPGITTLPVKLIDSPFNGQGTGSIDITNGVYTYAASESI